MSARIVLLVAILSLSLPIFGQKPTGVIVNVNAASYSQPTLARGSIVAAFGRDLATMTAFSETGATLLNGTQLFVEIDGTLALAPLLFVSPGQVNWFIPNDTPIGVARIELRDQIGNAHVGYIEIVDSAPGLFTTMIDGWPIVHARGSGHLPSLNCTDEGCKVLPIPYAFDGNIDISFLGTGFRNCPQRGGLRLIRNGVNSEPRFHTFPHNQPTTDLAAISPGGGGWEGWHSIQLRCVQTSNIGYVLLGPPR